MADSPAVNIADFIRDVPDFPKPGINFKDITPLLGDPMAFTACIDQMAEEFADQKIDVITAAEARGFIFAAPLAIKLLSLIHISEPTRPY